MRPRVLGGSELPDFVNMQKDTETSLLKTAEPPPIRLCHYKAVLCHDCKWIAQSSPAQQHKWGHSDPWYENGGDMQWTCRERRDDKRERKADSVKPTSAA